MHRSRLIAAAILLSTIVSAQTGTGSVNGNVTDATGSAVPAAAVKLTKAATQIVDQAQTNPEGYYVF